MFTVDPQIVKARKMLNRAQEKPPAGTILTGLKGLPVRIHCQLARGSDSDIFAYATLVHLMEDLTSEKQRWYLRDFASTELAGTKIILVQKARDQLIREFAKHPILHECDVLPVKSLRVLRLAASKLSLEAEIAELATPHMTEICSYFAEAALAGDTERTEGARRDFYSVINET